MSEVRILITDAHGETRDLRLHGSGFTIGRQFDTDVVLDHPAVSRRHAELFCDPFGRWWIRDLSSRHGIYINDQRVDDRIVTELDRIRIGKFSLRLAPPDRDPVTADFPSVPLVEESTDGTSIETLATPDHVGRRLKALVQLSAELSAAGDLSQRRKLLCTALAEQMPGCTALVLRLPLPEGPPQELARDGTGDRPVHVSRTMLTMIATERQALVASNVSTSVTDVDLSVAFTQQPLAALACPIEVHAEGIDLVYVSAGPEYATSEWLSFVSMGATIYQHDESARRLHNQLKEHDLIEHDLARARRMQQRLIPTAVDCPGMDVALGFEPCRWVGGDYVDVVASPGGQRTLLIADVCGKGLPAALVTGNLHAAVHAGLARHASLTDLFGDLNRYLLETLRGDSFVTMLALQVEPDSGRCRAVSAGHPVPVCVDPAGGLTRWDMSVTPPLGLMDQVYELHETSLSPGSWLFGYTDGAIEAANEKRDRLWEDGLDRILLAALADQPAARVVVERLNRKIDDFQGRAVPVDDRTLLVARLLPR